MKHLVGTDIGKFFFGGYSLENNGEGERARTHTHSSYAKLIVNDLVIAIYEKDIPVSTETVQQVHSKCVSVNSETQTIIMIAEKEKENFRQLYEDERIIGKHFRV